MKTEVKKLFVEALLSEEYPQTSSRLLRLDDNGNKVGYCCIGVLSDLAVKAGVAEWREFHKDLGYGLGYGIVSKDAPDDVDPETHALPECVAEWAGLEVNGMQDIIFGPNPQQDTLIALNDQRGYNFKQIAKVVEDKL